MSYQSNPDLKQDDATELETDLTIHDDEKKRRVKKRLEDLLEQKRLRENIGMDESHNYWDEL